jgi:16S rRNA (adenine1518-N6/adenine1519-N6)-dimethyltransferase
MSTRADTPHLTSPSRVRELLQQLELVPSKVLGQNFLIDVNILNLQLDAACLDPRDRVLEIGPGLGVLTQALLARVAHVTAIEKDRRLANFLQETFGHLSHLDLVHDDAMNCDLAAMLEAGVNKVVANLPYSVGSRLLIDLASAARPPERMVVMVQEEVAQRLAAVAGHKTFGLLSARVQLAYDVHIVKKVSPTCFLPPPKVGSMIVGMVRAADRGLRPERVPVFRHLLKGSFAHRRKQLQGILVKHFPDWGLPPATVTACLRDVDIPPQARPGDIPVARWVALANHVDIPPVNP